MKNLTNFRVNDITCCGKNSATEFSAIIVTLRYRRAVETIIVLPQQYCIINGEYDSLANIGLDESVLWFVYGLGDYVFSVGEDDVPALNFIEEYRKEHDLGTIFDQNSRILRDMDIVLQKMIYIRPGSVTAAVEQYCRDNKKSFSAIVEEALSFYATQKGIVEPDTVQLLKQALALINRIEF